MIAPELKPCPFCGGEASATPDHSHSRAWEIGCYNGQCGAEPSVWEVTKEQAITAWNTRADLARPKVKPLVWDDFDGMGAKASGFYQANYLITIWRGRGQFEVAMSYPGYQTGFDGERFHDTLKAAKAAAQADYEARILSALVPALGVQS